MHSKECGSTFIKTQTPQLSYLNRICTYLIDHFKCALENSIEDFWYLRCDGSLQFIDCSGHGDEDLGFAGSRNRTTLVVQEYRIQKGRYEILQDHISVI